MSKQAPECKLLVPAFLDVMWWRERETAKHQLLAEARVVSQGPNVAPNRALGGRHRSGTIPELESCVTLTDCFEPAADPLFSMTSS